MTKEHQMQVDSETTESFKFKTVNDMKLEAWKQTKQEEGNYLTYCQKLLESLKTGGPFKLDSDGHLVDKFPISKGHDSERRTRWKEAAVAEVVDHRDTLTTKIETTKNNDIKKMIHDMTSFLHDHQFKKQVHIQGNLSIEEIISGLMDHIESAKDKSKRSKRNNLRFRLFFLAYEKELDKFKELEPYKEDIKKIYVYRRKLLPETGDKMEVDDVAQSLDLSLAGIHKGFQAQADSETTEGFESVSNIERTTRKQTEPEKGNYLAYCQNLIGRLKTDGPFKPNWDGLLVNKSSSNDHKKAQQRSRWRVLAVLLVEEILEVLKAMTEEARNDDIQKIIVDMTGFLHDPQFRQQFQVPNNLSIKEVVSRMMKHITTSKTTGDNGRSDLLFKKYFSAYEKQLESNKDAEDQGLREEIQKINTHRIKLLQGGPKTGESQAALALLTSRESDRQYNKWKNVADDPIKIYGDADLKGDEELMRKFFWPEAFDVLDKESEGIDDTNTFFQ